VLAQVSSLLGWPVKDFSGSRFADHLTARQQAVLDVIAAHHPRPVTSTQLATELQLAAGTLNVTLRSLQRRQLIVAVPATARRRGGWTLWPWP
jgi:DNA-binding IclR family transcriptional regulator